MVDQRIKETVLKLDNKARKVRSKSMALRYGYDYTFLAYLLEEAGIEDIHLREDLINLVPDDLFNNVSLYIDDLETLAKEVIKMFKEINFYCYLRQGNTSISRKDKSSILKEYLLEKMPWAYQLYKDLYKSEHVFIVESDKYYGAAYMMPLIDEYFISINRYSPNDLADIETTIHELMHVYVASLAYGYSWKNHHNIITGFSKESASIYSSLSFFEFCLDHHILIDDAMLNRNSEDYEILSIFKLIHYFYEMGVKREKEVIISDGINYNFSKAHKLNEDVGVPFFQYHEEDCREDSFNTFLYGTGALEAYELLKREKEGHDTKEIINDFVLKYQYRDVNPALFKPDLTFMATEIKNHQKELEKKYPIPGYFVP